MAQAKATHYQRVRSKGLPWVLCHIAKNGSPKPRPDAFQFGVRYSLNGKRTLDTAATLDEALAIFKDRSVRLLANQNGVAMPEAAGKASESKTKIADAITEYLTTGKAYEKKWSKDTLRCHRDSTSLFLQYCKAEGVDDPGHPQDFARADMLSPRREAERRESAGFCKTGAYGLAAIEPAKDIR